MTADSGPVPSGDQLTVSAECMFRQIKPKWVEADGSVSSQNFAPAGSDEGLLSLDQESKTSAPAAMSMAAAKGVQTCGVMGLTVGEFGAHQLNVFDDPTTDPPPPNPAHAVADYRSLSRGQREKCGKKLRNIAVARGWLAGGPPASP